MKSIRLASLFTMLIVLLALASQAYTTPFNNADPKPQKTPGAQATEKADNEQDDNSNRPEKTPGAKATEKAAEKANRLKGKPEHFKGTIQSVDAGSLTLDLSGASVTITLTPETRIRIPGSAEAILQPGLTASVKARRDENNQLIASSVQVIPGKPVRAHRVGIVTAYTPGASITIQAHDGSPYTFALTGELKILPAERANQLAVGALVTIIAPRQPGSLNLTAAGIVVHPAGSGSGAFGAPTP